MYRVIPVLANVLYVPGLFYRAGIHLRNRAFDAQFFSARSLSQPTISVGNLTMGGTGKTPFVICLAELLKEMGYETAVLTRGYGRQQSRKTIILPPSENANFSVSLLGDEPALLRRRLPNAWLGISADRFYAASSIRRHEKRANQTVRLVYVLDDGFQRRDIHRDLDIVMIDSTRPPYKERLFPSGALREPLTELRRAHVVIINSPGSTDAAGIGNYLIDTPHIDRITENLRKYAPEADFFHCVQRIMRIIPFSTWIDQQKPHNSSSPPKTAFLTAAIGNPDRFKQDIHGMGIEIRGCAFFRDHSAIDWKNCIKSVQMEGAEAIIITEKDAVKISKPPDFPLFVAIQTTVIPELERFCQILRKRIFPGDSVAQMGRTVLK